MNKKRKKNTIVLLITIGIFVSVFSLVGILNARKQKNISNLQTKITLDLIANETQFDLLKNAPCKSIKGSYVSKELEEIGNKLSYAEEAQGAETKNIVDLKKYYSLLQVKDYLLSQEIAKKCDIEIESIVYFYEKDCSECIKQGYVLTELKKKYPWLRIYSFDRLLDFSIVETFAGLYDLSEDAPIIIIDGKKYSGLKKVNEIEAFIPALQEKKKQQEAIAAARTYILEEKFGVDIDEAGLEFMKFDKESLVFKYKDGSEDAFELILGLDEDGTYTLLNTPFQQDEKDNIENNSN